MENMIEKLILEVLKNLNEQDENDKDGHKSVPNSLDAQVDALLIKYDAVSSEIEGSDIMSEASFPQTLGFILEQLGEEPVDPSPGQVLAQDDDPAADEEKEVEDQEVEEVEGEDLELNEPESDPKLDVQMFAERVARLASMPEKLLDISTVILARAENYVRENYDDSTADALKEMLYDEHRLELPEDAVERVLDSDIPPPAAKGAGPGGGAAA